MGTVWLADDEPLSRDGAPVQVALKFIGGDGQPDEELIRLLRKEVRAALRLSHPNLVRVHSWHEHRGEPVFYSMEFVAGLDLKRLLEQQPQGRFSCRELQALLGQLVDALIYAHEQVGLVHRDLKPANILVTPEGQVKLADFGLARPDVSEDVYATTAGGTLCYASPQQRTGAAPTVSDDIYSLGAVLYHLLTGHLPYSLEELATGETPPPPVHPWRLVGRSGRDRRSITAEAAGTLLRCLSFNAEERPPDVRTFWKWWNAGPPVEEGRLASGSLTSAAKGMLAGTFILLLLLLALGAASRLSLDSALQRHAPRIADLGRKIGAAIFSTHTHNIGKTPSEPEETPTGDQPNILALNLLGADQVRFALFRGVDGIRDFEPRPSRTGELRRNSGIFLTNLTPGSFRLEAGVGEKRLGTKWTQIDFSLESGSNSLQVDFRPAEVALLLNAPVPFEILDAWSNVVITVKGPFSSTNDISFGGTRWYVPSALLETLDGLYAGRYRLRPDSDAAARLQLEVLDRHFQVVAGIKTNIVVDLESWRIPRFGHIWTNSLQMQLLPAPNGARFWAGRTETTVEQFSTFAAATGLVPTSINSITVNGATNIGLTWVNAFPDQSPSHPVVGVSWEEAKAFCEWLTQTELSMGRLTERQRYSLPTSAQWTILAGNYRFPWGESFPPNANQGNYAGNEVIGPDWPPTWNSLVLEYNDPQSPRTVKVGRYAGNVNRFDSLAGNAAEWCDSWYSESQSHSRQSDWTIPSGRLKSDRGGKYFRVVRGGSWFDSKDEDMLRTSTEWAETPDTRNDRVGFRVILIEESANP